MQYRHNPILYGNKLGGRGKCRKENTLVVEERRQRVIDPRMIAVVVKGSRQRKKEGAKERTRTSWGQFSLVHPIHLGSILPGPCSSEGIFAMLLPQ